MKLPYSPDDDEAAHKLINIELRNPNPTRWAALTTDEYVLQTDRVLRAMCDAIAAAFVHRNGDLRQLRARWLAKEISDAARAAAVAEFEEWKGRTVHFQTLAKTRREQIATKVRRLTGDDIIDRLRDPLLLLAEAVADHRARVTAEYDPTPEDKLLWARLATLTFPVKNGTRSISLEEFLSNRRVTTS